MRLTKILLVSVFGLISGKIMIKYYQWLDKSVGVIFVFLSFVNMSNREWLQCFFSICFLLDFNFFLLFFTHQQRSFHI